MHKKKMKEKMVAVKNTPYVFNILSIWKLYIGILLFL